MYDLVEETRCQFFLKPFCSFSQDFKIDLQKGVNSVRHVFRTYNILKIPVTSTTFSFLSLQKTYIQTYVMLCYTVTYIAPLTGDYSEALCIYKNVKQNASCYSFFTLSLFMNKTMFGSSTCSYFTVFRVMDPSSPLHHRS